MEDEVGSVSPSSQATSGVPPERVTRRTYKRPPIQEAVCQIAFRDAEWDFTSPAEIYSIMRDRYPNKPVQQLDAGYQLRGPEADRTLRFEQGSPKVRLTSNDGNQMVTIAENILSVHVLNRYCGWEEFRERIDFALDAYRRTVSPMTVERLGVRYINRIELETASVKLEDYFTCAPTVPPELSVSIGNFFQRVEMETSSSSLKLVHTFGSVDTKTGGAAFLLDLDVIREWTEDYPLSADDSMTHIDQLRDFERDAFESLITEKLRAMFDDD